jgi:hypothetical protein
MWLLSCPYECFSNMENMHILEVLCFGASFLLSSCTCNFLNNDGSDGGGGDDDDSIGSNSSSSSSSDGGGDSGFDGGGSSACHGGGSNNISRRRRRRRNCSTNLILFVPVSLSFLGFMPSVL